MRRLIDLPAFTVLALLVGFAATPMTAKAQDQAPDSVTDMAQDGDQPFQLTCDDGYLLDGKVRVPAGLADDTVERVVLLVHGSGPQTMDEDLTALTRDGKTNLFFRDVSDALADSGFAVIRYNKRAYQVRLSQQADPGYFSSESFKTFYANPLAYFVEDAMAGVGYAKDRFPNADVYILGHSEGAFVALQVARQMEEVKGVALVGFLASSFDVAIFEQVVYRPLPLFEDLDTNGDEILDADELGVGSAIAASLQRQMPVLDLDADSTLSMMEFQAGNLSNLLIQDIMGTTRVQEAQYPRPAEILKDAKFKVAFFQGLLDNQTPAYNAKAVEMVVKVIWKKDNFSFTYFPGLGHALDRRESYEDLRFDTIDPAAKSRMVAEMSSFFR